MFSVLRELFRYMRAYRKFWMAPIVVVLLGLGVLMVVAQSTAIGPFIYAIF
jgi:hypothetical protein